ncbi:hypothetical protein COJ45_27825 [Bacillus cereus]|nr:hypothetical protein COJ45_27825 [Bacillus cereus]
MGAVIFLDMMLGLVVVVLIVGIFLGLAIFFGGLGKDHVLMFNLNGNVNIGEEIQMYGKLYLDLMRLVFKIILY